MKKLVVYVHGKGGNIEEAKHYESLFLECDVIGFDYVSNVIWDAKEEFLNYFNTKKEKYESIILIANSIGAYFSMSSLSEEQISEAYFISPIVNMEKLICDMMKWANVSEEELFRKKEIVTNFNETLSYKYLSFARNNPINWNVKTHILYGENDYLTSFETINEFKTKTNSTLDILKNGEHWFHTNEQMKFLDDWILKYKNI